MEKFRINSTGTYPISPAGMNVNITNCKNPEYILVGYKAKRKRASQYLRDRLSTDPSQKAMLCAIIPTDAKTKHPETILIKARQIEDNEVKGPRKRAITLVKMFPHPLELDLDPMACNNMFLGCVI